MTRTIDRDVTTLRAAMGGTVLLPGDGGYDEARSVWNGDIDRRPAAIARCAGPDDVAAALRYAHDAGLQVAVRGGGHGYWGAAVPEGGLMIDLSPIHHVVVDPDARRARVGGGAALGQLDAATAEHGLAVPAGTVSHTGVGGLTLGGGWGWLSRLHGLTIDNLESAEVVLADGRCVRASADEHPDLFWALRGGGGNFGVVTEFEFRLHEVGPLVHLAMLFVEQDRAALALRTARDALDGGSLAATTSAGVACISAPPAPFVPVEHHFSQVAAVILIGFGTADEHAADVAAVRAALQPAFEMATPLPYPALQQMLDEGVPWGIRAYTKGLYLDELTDATIEALAERLPGRRSPQSQVLLLPLVGAVNEVPDDATAFGGSRSLRYAFGIEAISTDADDFAHDRQWVRDTWNALRPAAVHDGAYVNLMAEFEGDSLRNTYGAAKFDRLRRIKAEYDPANVFRHNANIPPA
jgi:FAD/FMN-containing dehydrogenase